LKAYYAPHKIKMRVQGPIRIHNPLLWAGSIMVDKSGAGEYQCFPR